MRCDTLVTKQQISCLQENLIVAVFNIYNVSNFLLSDIWSLHPAI